MLAEPDAVAPTAPAARTGVAATAASIERPFYERAGPFAAGGCRRISG